MYQRDLGGRVDRADSVETIEASTASVAPERGVTGIAAGRRETIGEAGVGWRRRTESWSMMGLLSCEYCNRISPVSYTHLTLPTKA